MKDKIDLPLYALITLLFLIFVRESSILTQVVGGYLHPHLTEGFLSLHLPDYLTRFHWKGSFYIHAFLGPLVLFSGLGSLFSLASADLLGKKSARTIHRFCGNLYFISVLGFAAPTGFIMSFYALGGWPAKSAFIALSLLWFGVTLQGYRLIQPWHSKRDTKKHGALMIWSFCLACSAILQRRLVYWAPYFEWGKLDSTTVYILSAWGSWVFMSGVAGLIYLAFFKLKKRERSRRCALPL